MNMTELYAKYDAKEMELKEIKEMKLKEIDARIEKLEAQLERAKARRNKIWYSIDWIKYLVYPLAEALKAETGAEKYEVFGPFGLRGETSIYLRREKMSGCITLTSGSKFRLFYDTGEKVGGYAPNSLGAMNGMNNVTAPLPDDITEIAALLRWYEKEEV